jgi:PAS domain S-box-containing protein
VACYHGARMVEPSRPARSLADPPPRDESRDYIVRTLPPILWATLVASALSAAVAGATGQPQVAAGLLVSVLDLALALVLTRRGRHRLASALFLGNGLVLATYLLYFGSGLHDIAVLDYPLVIIIAGMLLEGPAFAAVCGLCLASVAFIAWSQLEGRVVVAYSGRPESTVIDLVYVTIVLVVVAGAVRLLAGALRHSLREARAGERALRASEETFNKAFRSNPVIMVITSLDDDGILDVNEAFAAASGYGREEVLGRSTVELQLWIDAGERDAIREAVLARGSVRERPVRFRRRSGESAFALVSGEAVELGGRRCALYAVVDVTARKRAEDALAASEERYRLISEVISDYSFSTRLGPDGRLQLDWVAGAFERITGYTFEEYVARGGWPAALHPDDVAQDARDLEEVHANRPVVTEVRTIARSGAVRWVRVYAHPVWDEAENRLAGIYGAVQDVTEYRQAAAEREALVRELEAKNAELERFTYTVSHDLKSPLITVRSFLGFVERDALSGNVERLRADIGRITTATDRMERLLKELLDLSRIGRVASPPCEIGFGEIAREAIALVRGPAHERGVEIEVAEELPRVWGDRTRLVEAVQNLLDNAVKFMGSQPRPRVSIGARREAERTVFYVRDNGMGIEPRHHGKVFGLFEKLDPRSEGTGVGLALVKRIVEVHEGTVWVESEGEGRGTTFCFTLKEKPS